LTSFFNSFSHPHLEGGPLRATPGVLSSPSKDISHPSLVIYLSPASPIKLKRRLQIGGRLLIATHMDQSFMMRESETGRKRQIIFMTLFFWNVLETLQCFVPATAKGADMQIQNHFSRHTSMF
jgi:hypothetical protein